MSDFTGDKDPVTSLNNPKYATPDAHMGFSFAVSSGSGVAEIVMYLMRAYDTSLARDVYWYATTIDSLGAEYPGTPSNLTRIRLLKRRQ